MRRARSCKNAAFSKSLNNQSKFKVGWVRDAHGLKGELYIQLFAKQADWLESFKQFWLETKTGLEAFEVARAKPHKDGLIVKSNAIEDRTHAEKLKGAQFFIPNEYLVAKEGESIFLKQIEGFKVVEADQELGIIKSFATNGAQDLLVVQGIEKEMLIPFVEAFVKNIDYDLKTLFVELPEGLLTVGEE